MPSAANRFLTTSSPLLRPPVAVVATVAVTIAFAVSWATGRQSIDFLSFYGAGLAVLRGEMAQLYDPAYLAQVQAPWIDASRAGGVYPYFYAPAFALLYVPLALLPMIAARIVWGVLSLGLIGLALRLSRRWSELSWPVTLMLILALPPLYITLYLLHMTPLLLLLFAGLALLAWQDRGGARAGLLAGGLLIKPHLLVPLAVLWLVRRRWRELAGLAVAGAAVATVSLAASVPATAAYLTTLRGSFTAGLASLESQNVNLALYSGLHAFLPSGAATAGSFLLTLLILAALVSVWGRSRRTTSYHHALLWTAPLLVTPYLGAYDLLLLFVPLSFLAGGLAEDRALRGMVLVAWAPQLAMAMVKGPHVKLVPWAVLAFYAFCWWRAGPRASAASPAVFPKN